ncbi:AraC family transcriptional regulator [Aureimonas frigidaquae]|uniref:AraC family transcriptional regulator n=1 Tax=Aureimonas frigidaquae TaxID=424757 RepID=UPI0007844379|nr:AraC family transcriptional regulator [Aureimonas frigidaquae]
MSDPLTQILALMRPSASFSKLVTGTGRWAVRPPAHGPFYAALLQGSVLLSIDGERPERLDAGDFVLLPDGAAFAVTSIEPPAPGRDDTPAEVAPGIFHLGPPSAPDTRMLVGYCHFGSADSALLLSLLAGTVIVRGERRLTQLVELLSEEAGAVRPGRDVVLTRLLEVLLLEAFRAQKGPAPAPGLLRGLADPRLAVALRLIHAHPADAWTVALLARQAGLSRSSFFERFRREVGTAPMDYLLSWRMALARDMLLDGGVSVGDAARQVGYSSSSTFSTAFARAIGMSPKAYARAARA